jgi:hypothetical protein
MIRFKCPNCGKEIRAGDEHAGKKSRCPGCKELFQIPLVRAVKPAPAPVVERRTPPPPKDADYEVVEDDDEAPPRRKPARVEDDEDEAPRKKKRPRDDEDDEAIAEAPRKKRPARDEDDEDDRPRRKRARDVEDDEDDEPRPRRKRARDDYDDEDEDDDRPRRKKKRRKGPYADCPNCGCRGDATRVYYSFGWGFLPTFFSTVRCNRCRTEYNGKHGDYNLKRYLIYMAIVIPIALVFGFVVALLDSK